MKKIINYLFKDNLIYLLIFGLIPVLLGTTTFENSYVIGLIVLIILLINTLIFSLIKVNEEIKVPIYLIISSILVTLIEVFLKGYSKGFYEVFIYVLPLLVVNPLIMNIIINTKKEKVLTNLKETLKKGILFIVIISVFGLIREFIGTGTITIMNNISFITGYKEIIHIFDGNKLFITSGGVLITLGIFLGLINNLYKGEVK